MNALQRLSFVIILFAFTLLINCTPGGQNNLIEEQNWIHGSLDCSVNNDLLIQVVRFNDTTWILRQNKCIHYEAPFMFLFIGANKALLVDTGATEAEDKFPLLRVVDSLIQFSSSKNLSLVVAHSHSHSDHHAGDGQFAGKPNTDVVGLSVNEVKTFFGIENWPEDNSSFDLGGRTLDIIPIPGHEKSSLAFYDRNTRLLLTGDTFYPGRLYIEDWTSYKKSITKLKLFNTSHQVSYILGNHIEMSNTAGIDYPVGTMHQPDEIKLPLKMEDLDLLFNALEKLGDTPARAVYPKFIIYPK